MVVFIDRFCCSLFMWFMMLGSFVMKMSLLVLSVVVVLVVMFFIDRLNVWFVGEKFSGESSMILWLDSECWIDFVLILCISFVCWKFMLLIMFIGCVVMKLLDIIDMCVLVIGVLGRFWLKVVLIFRCSLLEVFLVDFSVVVFVMCMLFMNWVFMLCRVSCFFICGCELCMSMMCMFIVCNSVMLLMSVFSMLVWISLLLKLIMNVLLWKE